LYSGKVVKFKLEFEPSARHFNYNIQFARLHYHQLILKFEIAISTVSKSAAIK
jgi:hypothetical protein